MLQSQTKSWSTPWFLPAAANFIWKSCSGCPTANSSQVQLQLFTCIVQARDKKCEGKVSCSRMQYNGHGHCLSLDHLTWDPMYWYMYKPWVLGTKVICGQVPIDSLDQPKSTSQLTSWWTSRSTSQSTYQLTINRYLDWHQHWIGILIDQHLTLDQQLVNSWPSVDQLMYLLTLNGASTKISWLWTDCWLTRYWLRCLLRVDPWPYLPLATVYLKLFSRCSDSLAWARNLGKNNNLNLDFITL